MQETGNVSLLSGVASTANDDGGDDEASIIVNHEDDEENVPETSNVSLPSIEGGAPTDIESSLENEDADDDSMVSVTEEKPIIETNNLVPWLVPPTAENSIIQSNALPSSSDTAIPSPQEDASNVYEDVELTKRTRYIHSLNVDEDPTGYEIRMRKRVDDYSAIQDNDSLFKEFKRIMKSFTAPSLANPNRQEPFFGSFRESYYNIITFRALYNTKLWIPVAWATMLGCGKAPEYNASEVLIELEKGEEYSFDQPLNFNIWTPNFMIVYANFIEYSSIGHVSAPVLKVVPLELSVDSEFYRLYESRSEELHRVTHSQLNNVRFQLRKIDGTPLEFLNKLQNVILTLKFISVE